MTFGSGEIVKNHFTHQWSLVGGIVLTMVSSLIAIHVHAAQLIIKMTVHIYIVEWSMLIAP